MCWEGRDTRFVFVELFNQSTVTIKVTRVLRESCLFVAVVVILSLFFCSIIFFGLVVSFVSYSIQKFPMTAFLPLGLSSSAPASSCNNLVAMHCFHSRCTDCQYVSWQLLDIYGQGVRFIVCMQHARACSGNLDIAKSCPSPHCMSVVRRATSNNCVTG